MTTPSSKYAPLFLALISALCRMNMSIVHQCKNGTFISFEKDTGKLYIDTPSTNRRTVEWHTLPDSELERVSLDEVMCMVAQVHDFFNGPTKEAAKIAHQARKLTIGLPGSDYGTKVGDEFTAITPEGAVMLHRCGESEGLYILVENDPSSPLVYYTPINFTHDEQGRPRVITTTKESFAKMMTVAELHECGPECEEVRLPYWRRVLNALLGR